MTLMWVRVLSKMMIRTSFSMGSSSIKIAPIAKETFSSESSSIIWSSANQTTPWPNHHSKKPNDPTFQPLLKKANLKSIIFKFSHPLHFDLLKNTKNASSADQLFPSLCSKNTSTNAIRSLTHNQILRIWTNWNQEQK